MSRMLLPTQAPLRYGVASLLALLSIAAPVTLAADGEITIVGQGRATAAPEYTRIRVDVTSICYETSRAAKDASAQLANEVLAVLRAFQLTPLDKVVVTGGVNVLRTETVYVGSDARVLCDMKWRSTNSLILETASIDALPDIQDEVLTVVDAVAVNPGQVAQTYAELDQPRFLLRDATERGLKRTAQAAAYDDARSQFDVFQDRCHFSDPRLTSIMPPEYDIYARKDGQAIAADDASSTPIIPDDMAVDATWKFVWTFTPVAGCPL